jgi:hypothetical protein
MAARWYAHLGAEQRTCRPQARRIAARAVLLLAACGLVACASLRGSDPVSDEQVRAIRNLAAAAAQQEALHRGGPESTPAPRDAQSPLGGNEATAATQKTSREPLEQRIRASLDKDLVLKSFAAVADGSRYAFVLARPAACGAAACRQAILFLLEVGEPIAAVASHEFGLDDAASVPESISQTFATAAADSVPLVLAELMRHGAREAPGAGHPGGGGVTNEVCGWWLRAAHPRFVCAPKTPIASSYLLLAGALVERWTARFPGEGFVAEAVAQPSGRPGSAVASPRLADLGVASTEAGTRDFPFGGFTGRALGLSSGRWTTLGEFRCLAASLDDALRDVGWKEFESWQHESVRRLVTASRRAADELKTDVALARLRDALELDRCNADAWRLLGRLEYQSGYAARAAPALAISLTLAPSHDATLVDLADALAALNPDPPPGRLSWRFVQAVLDDRRTTQPLLSPIANPPSAKAMRRAALPRDVAVALYSAWLERTADDPRALEPVRRHVQTKLAELGAPPATRP